MTAAIKTVGAGSIPHPDGRLLNASIPLVVAEVDQQGFGLRLRDRRRERTRSPLLWLFLAAMPGAFDLPTWHATWAEVSSIDKGPRSIVVWTASSSCRFATLRPSRLKPILHEATRHGVQVRTVRWTLGWWHQRRKRAT